MNITVDAKDVPKSELREVDILSFIDRQIYFCYKAVSKIYTLITADYSIQFRWS